MNATRWHSLAEFVKMLGREGYCEIEETEKGWFLKWIDKSPEALARQAAIEKKERSERSEEERESKLLAEQIEKAQAANAAAQTEFTELKRENLDEPIKLALLDSKKDSSEKPLITSSTGSFGFKIPSKPAWLKDSSKDMSKKKPKTLSSGSDASSTSSSAPQTRKLSAMEQIMEEEKKKRQRHDSLGMGPSKRFRQ
ncbi:hypothetical protein HDU67_001265 [Dinochytrium kinnereticum]|nr:hypothetical protein HDU67_001265 [Dinochytrium kinnereticum]